MPTNSIYGALSSVGFPVGQLLQQRPNPSGNLLQQYARAIQAQTPDIYNQMSPDYSNEAYRSAQLLEPALVQYPINAAAWEARFGPQGSAPMSRNIEDRRFVTPFWMRAMGGGGGTL